MDACSAALRVSALRGLLPGREAEPPLSAWRLPPLDKVH